jgi:hypothetical protein
MRAQHLCAARIFAALAASCSTAPYEVTSSGNDSPNETFFPHTRCCGLNKTIPYNAIIPIHNCSKDVMHIQVQVNCGR